jgi:hypothetical protein
MSVLATYQGRPEFPTGVPLEVTGGLDVLQANTRAVDEASLLGRDALCAHAYVLEGNGANPHYYGQWSFQYWPGLTTLTWSGYNTLSADVTEWIRFKAVVDPVGAPDGVVLNQTQLTAGAQTITVVSSMAGRGWNAGQIIEIHVEIYDPGASTPGLTDGQDWGRYETIDFTVSPLSALMPDSWPGVPTYTTGPDPVKLTQHAGALDWLARRIGLVPRPLFQSVAFAMSLYHLDDFAGDAPIDYQHWAGGFVRGALDRLTALVRYECNTNVAEDIRLFVNGSLAASQSMTAGQRGRWDPVINISAHGSTTPIRLAIRTRTTVAGEPPRGSRISVSHVRLYRASPTPATLPTAPDPEASVTWSTAKSRLNSLSTIAAAVYDRIQGDPETWNKARLYRQNYGYDAPAKNFFESRHIPVVWNRVGARLVVRGKGVRLGYGGAIWTLTEPKYPDGTYNLQSAIEENLIDATGYQSRVVYLSGLKGLGLGTAYNMRGDVRYAAEHLL